MIRSTLVTVLAMGLLVACSVLKITDPMKDFEDASRAYGQALIWSEYNVAAAFLKSNDQGEKAAATGHLSLFRVTAYEPRFLKVLEKDARVRQIVKISYFKKDNLLVKTVSDDQLWEYDTEKDSWVLTTGFPKLD